MKSIWDILTEQGAEFDIETLKNGNIACKIYRTITECYNGTPIGKYKEYTGTTIIADKSGKIIRFENKEVY